MVDSSIRRGRQSLEFKECVCIKCGATVVGKKESQGPLGECFDVVYEDDFCGKETWEEAESEFQREALDKVLIKGGLTSDDIRYVFGGDLLSQLIATSFGVSEYEIPLFGIYGACSTIGEALALSAMTVNAGYADNVIAIASSHFASAEKQFRFPLEYGNQRPEASTWTVSGSGAYIVSRAECQDKAKAVNNRNNRLEANHSDIHTDICSKRCVDNEDNRFKDERYNDNKVYIKGITTGKIVDYGVKDSMNMGACMAPAAADLIEANLKDYKIDETYYDCIVTGDLGYTGQKILIDLLLERGIDVSQLHTDCGIQIYDRQTQSTKSGGSGCGCSAVTLNAWLLPKLLRGEYRRVLFIPTGALLSTVSYNEGKSVPGIAHGIILTTDK